MVSITCKVVMCGDYSVGKTTFVKQFLGGDVMEGYKPTVGVDIGRKAFDINSDEVTFQIWDLSGQETFSLIRKQFYGNSNGGILIYDISRRETYDNILNWTDEMLEQTGKIPIVLVANKIDLKDQIEDTVAASEGKSLSEIISSQTAIETPFVEASALYQKNNLEPFYHLARTILSRR
ncbi:MAG: GTP-binding protein [Candidatus Hodarchaeota archaeon]